MLRIHFFAVHRSFFLLYTEHVRISIYLHQPLCQSQRCPQPWLYWCPSTDLPFPLARSHIYTTSLINCLLFCYSKLGKFQFRQNQGTISLGKCCAEQCNCSECVVDHLRQVGADVQVIAFHCSLLSRISNYPWPCELCQKGEGDFYISFPQGFLRWRSPFNQILLIP